MADWVFSIVDRLGAVGARRAAALRLGAWLGYDRLYGLAGRRWFVLASQKDLGGSDRASYAVIGLLVVGLAVLVVRKLRTRSPTT